MAYLGTRGYTIPKSELDIAQQDRIRRELSVAPAAAMMGMARPLPYPVYRESTNKFFLPQFYGKRTFGPMSKPSKLPPPIPLAIPFNGTLRPDQQVVADLALDSLRNKGGGLLELYCGYGKTVVGLYIAAALKVKTVVLVHKEFLMDQWTERIEMFLPGARVGRIQAQTLDMDNKDIVMVMIQSLATKEYPMDLFKGVGLVIVDECHHMSAEVFSNALFKAVTPFMLGLSATMTRKDGLSRVFKMFLGEVVAKRVRTGKTEVRVLRYSNPDDEFNETVFGYTGTVNFSSMLTKVSACGHRLDYIAKVVERLVNEEEREQILVLTHYRAMIDGLSDRFTAMGIDHGYYVGGMKPADLEQSATRRVVLGTFAMAEEGLDIKTLDTEVLATSKSDVVQAVGRVQRSPNKVPLVIDIVDPHACFRRQYEKRLRFYKKSQFEVVDSVARTAKTTGVAPTNGTGGGACATGAPAPTSVQQRKKREPRSLISGDAWD
jgi:superfamily II DNA or RNA helicase